MRPSAGRVVRQVATKSAFESRSENRHVDSCRSLAARGWREPRKLGGDRVAAVRRLEGTRLIRSSGFTFPKIQTRSGAVPTSYKRTAACKLGELRGTWEMALTGAEIHHLNALFKTL